MEDEARDILRASLSTKTARDLWEATQAIFNQDFAGQVLSFDTDAADAYAEIAASRKAAGRPISQFDAMIAAMARSRGAGVATRNVKDFAEYGIDIVDPWKI
ncbi:MAG: PIN domain-containing protein [Candidimonas sp.]|nr:MAG: PIN domain-containing protein [Candidimonas sp.]TAM79064.1 MAG: PIN domain-containing protein [Candidimonas sp.]